MDIHSSIGTAVTEQPFGDPDVIARAIVAACDTDDLLPLVVAEVEHQQRNRRLALEAGTLTGNASALAGIFERVMASPVTADDELHAAGNLRKLFASPFALGDGTVVTWGTATAEQHEQRAGFLETMAATTLATAKRHRAAALVLRRQGAKCLAELGTVTGCAT